MSDRINELFEQALDKTVCTTLDQDQILNLKTEFAQLIIAECARVADENFNGGFCPVGGFIKEHFNKLTMLMITL